MSEKLECSPPCVELLLMQHDVKDIKTDLRELKDSWNKFLEEKYPQDLKALDDNKAPMWVADTIKAVGVGCFLIVVFYILTKVGLPTP